MLKQLIALASRRRTDDGASAVEYGLLVALIAALIVAAVFAIGGVTNEAFQDTCTGMTEGDTTIDADCEEAA